MFKTCIGAVALIAGLSTVTMAETAQAESASNAGDRLKVMIASSGGSTKVANLTITMGSVHREVPAGTTLSLNVYDCKGAYLPATSTAGPVADYASPVVATADAPSRIAVGFTPAEAPAFQTLTYIVTVKEPNVQPYSVKNTFSEWDSRATVPCTAVTPPKAWPKAGGKIKAGRRVGVKVPDATATYQWSINGKKLRNSTSAIATKKKWKKGSLKLLVTVTEGGRDTNHVYRWRLR